MGDKRKLKLKKFFFHPATVLLLLTLLVMALSAILSALEMQGTYNIANTKTKELEQTLISVENMMSFDGMKYIFSNATKNFISFAPLGTLLISLIGLTIAEATGLIEAFSNKYIKKMPKYFLTFLIVFLATISSLINEVGYAILIPLAALVYFINNKNPILGIITAFCGVSFGYGVSIFVGTMEVDLIEYTRSSALLIDSNAHVPLTGNLVFIIVASLVLSIVGTIIIEKIIAPKVGKYKKDDDLARTEQYSVIEPIVDEQEKIEKEKVEKRGLKYALITAITVFSLFVYMLIPNLPYSGMLLDMNEITYANQLFGPNSYFQDGFTFLLSMFFFVTGLAYGFGARTIKNDKALIEKTSNGFSKLGSLFFIMFMASQFIAIFKKTNIGLIIASWFSTLLSYLDFSGIPLIVATIILIGVSNFVLTGSATKWMVFAPVVVPMFMQSNISPAFAQIVMRAGDSITKGYTPLLASFVIYIGYLNIYNLNKDKPYTIRRSLKLITPYFIIISLTWILLIVGWYIIGLPIGPKVYPTI